MQQTDGSCTGGDGEKAGRGHGWPLELETKQGDEVNTEASNKHAVFTLLLAPHGEKWREKEVIMGFECTSQKSDTLRKQIKWNYEARGRVNQEGWRERGRGRK